MPEKRKYAGFDPNAYDSREHDRGGDFVTRTARALMASDPDHRKTEALWARVLDKSGEKKENIKLVVQGEIVYGSEYCDLDGKRRARLLKDDYYYYLEIGLRYKDKPGEFVANRTLVLNEEEVTIIKELLEGLNSPEEKALKAE